MSYRQYIENLKKGDTVIHGKNNYRVQDDGRGWLHIVIISENKRKKISIQDLPHFNYGSYADYIFNEWWRIYPDYKIFNQFAESEIKWSK